MPRRVAPPSLADAIYRQLKEDIFEFRLLPGDRFSEGEIAERMAASRTPVRQALYRLQREGQVQVHFRSGWQVSPLDFERFEELYDQRTVLELEAVRRLCLRPEFEQNQTLLQLGRTWLVQPEQRLHDEGIAGEIYLFKNNTDSAGNSYGCHENYLVGRSGEFTRLADVLIPFGSVDPLADGAPDRVAEQLGFGAAFAFASSAEVFDEIRRFSNPRTGYDLRGVDYDRLRRSPVQWPAPPKSGDRNPIRYLNDGVSQDAYVDATGRRPRLAFPTPSRRAVFHPRPHVDPAERPDADYPLVLNTGRLQHQWHTMTKTGRVDKLNRLNGRPFVEVHPEDATPLGIVDGASVEVTSRRGRVVLPAVVTDRVRPGDCFAPFHWNDEQGPDLTINAVTNDAVDPDSLQPEFKAYQAQVIKNAQTMAQVFIDNGYDVVSGGTENHLFLLSLIKQDITGKDADAALGRAFITVNKNSVPNDPRSPFVTSGLRIGTPAVTTRGFKEDECRQLAGWICDVLANIGNDEVEGRVREQVKALCAKFPVYGN